MATVVEFETVEGFILDDPIAGKLDNVEYTLGGLSFSDITLYMTDISWTRGKARDLDRFSAGTLSVELNNHTRIFDPSYAAGAFFGQIKPRRKIRVTTDGVRQFTGVIDDWNFSYNPGGWSKAVITATDDFTLLARQTVSGVGVAQATGARVTAVLDQAGVLWPVGLRIVSAGESELGADTLTGNALEYLQKVETSEQGALFIDKSGNLVFQDRLTATPTSDSLITFADDGTGIPYTQVTVNYGTELLINTVTVTSAAGSSTAQNSRSRTSYGVSSESVETLVDSTAQLLNIADFIVSKYGEPEYRFESIALNLDEMTAPNKASVLGMELWDVILIKFTPNGVGAPIAQYGQVIKLDNDIEKKRHDIIIGIAALDWTFLVLDDVVFGTMGNNYLAF